MRYNTKKAEAANTHLMPMSKPLRTGPSTTSKAVIRKTAMDDAVNFASLKEEQAGKHPQMGALPSNGAVENQEPPKVMKPHVDVTGMTTAAQPTEKKASRYALPSLGKYPLDSYEQVSRAVDYFEKHAHVMPVETRREYCLELVPRAAELGIPVGQTALHYGGTKYASAEHIQASIDLRKNVVSQEPLWEMLDKIANDRVLMPADLFCEVLDSFDKLAGIDHLYDTSIPDPYVSTFYKEGQGALPDKGDPDGSIIVGNDYITEKQLAATAVTKRLSLLDTFGEEFVNEFVKDPRGIFDSLPNDQKKFIMRLSTDNAPGTERLS